MAKCKSEGGVDTCTCPEGMEGDGLASGTGCSPGGIECGGEKCSVGAVCEPDVSGRERCTCPVGVTGDGLQPGSGCTAGPECGGVTCVADAECKEDKCTCPQGMIGDGTLSGSGCGRSLLPRRVPWPYWSASVRRA